ncbi:MAG: hypothetical protein V1648_03960 [Candidatus Aenigmatarchaeota archaeon]
MKRGFLLSLDAIVAITLLLSVSTFLAGISFTYSTPELRYQRYYYAGKDIAALFQEARISSVSDVVNLTKYNLTQEEMNRTILDVIGSFWAGGNMSVASNLTRDIFSEVLGNTGLNYEVSFNDETIYASDDSYSDFVARLSTVVSGYEKTKPVNGYLAKVYVTKVSKTNSEFIYFGGYEGDGNITKVITLPVDVNVTGAYLEMNVGNNFLLYINGQAAGTYVKSAVNFSADNWTICSKTNPSYCSYFAAGQNIIQLNFTTNQSTYVGGGYLKVTYKTSELTEYTTSGNASDYYEFPGIRGIINLYSSFYVPGTLKNMSARLHYNNNLSLNNQGVPVYFVIGSKEIYRSNATGEHVIDIPEKNISDAFGGKANLTEKLSNATIPIRFGTDTFAFTSGEGTSDSILITDISGSMGGSTASCDVQTTACEHTDCNTASGCQNYRIDVAKDVDNDFVDNILNYTGNMLGLISYSTTVYDSHPLSNDSSSLHAEIDGYTPTDYTCISCGILIATDMLLDAAVINETIKPNSTWLYNVSFPSSEPPVVNGSEWTWQNYSDDGWSSGQSILGFESPSYFPNINTNIGNNGGNYYFRKHFNFTKAMIDSADLYVLSDNAAEIYLNGHLVYNDTSEHNARYWNNYYDVLDENFESYYASGDNRLYSTEINRTPGYWIVDGTPDADKEVFIMANYAGYPAHKGTDVMVFRDMDAYGSVETHLNLSGKANLTLSYWWSLGDDEPDSGEYSNMRIWDGSWHTVKTYNASHVYGDYHKETIDLNAYNMVNNFTVRFGSRSSSDTERFYVDDVRIAGSATHIETSYFNDGENVVAVRLRNNDAVAAKFDAALNITMKRYKAMLVMSDGLANRPLGVNATEDAVSKACDARRRDIQTYTVAFGTQADGETLKKIACWNCTTGSWIPNCDRFYNSTDAEELQQIYRSIARDIANASYAGQLFNFTGNVSMNNILYTDSYIYFDYTPVVRTPEYGEITLNFESPRLGASTGDIMTTDNETGTKEGWFFIPGDTEVSTEVLDSKITSYSSYYWTDRLWVNSSSTPNQNWTRVYWLANYSSDYEKLGDPYIVQIPPNILTANGNNSFKIGTGLRPTPLSGGKGASPDDRVIYTLGIKGISLTQYSDVFAKAKGSTVTIYYDANGDNVADSSSVVEIGPDPDDNFDPMNDSIDNGFMKLIDRMNFMSDVNSGVVDLNYTASGPSGTGDGSSGNPVDLEITEDVNFNSDFISQISSMWGPAIMEVKIWG